MMKNAYDIFFTTLANVNRLKIIKALMGKNRNVSEICIATGLKQTTVSHNLRRLLRCGFVFVEQKGKQHIYRLNKATIQPLMKIIDRHSKRYCEALRR